MTAAESRKTIRVGVFTLPDTQLLDVACVDVLASMSYEYFTLIGDFIPPSLLALAPSMQIFYISTIQPGSFIQLTAQVKLPCTHHFSDPAVAPGQLDVILLPGPDPAMDFNAIKNATGWLAAHAARPETDILSICTGILVAGEAGILKGKKACGPRGVQGELAKKFKETEWVGEELRWVRDGNIWSSGGVTNGNDLVGAYARLSGRIPGPVAEAALSLTETGDRPQRYETGKMVWTLGIVWQMLKATFMGLGKKTTA
ncbi:hypothetical protein VTJ83DRAFT_251 [Remersonia thermophila]|uniref:DJ-1/PfpI domain-containing protein n=1 Tax=Remersonia thermophila TaxID=72144 RepID=A0ABR4DKK7_9PEZI